MLRAASSTGVAAQPEISRYKVHKAPRALRRAKHITNPSKGATAPRALRELSELSRLTGVGFYRVADRMFVGRRPDKERLRQLQALGVCHIVNLEDGLSLSRPLRRSEHEGAGRFGMEVVDMPLSPLLPLRFKRVEEIIRYMTNKDNQPVYVHCLFGQERALFLAGLIRVYYDGWTPERAYREMRDYGYRPYLVPVLSMQFWHWARSAKRHAQMQPTVQRPSAGNLPPESSANAAGHPQPPSRAGTPVLSRASLRAPSRAPSIRASTPPVLESDVAAAIA